MNEEEKKAIEMLDKFITEHKLYNIRQSEGLEDNIKILLNLIEKQQKDIEHLKIEKEVDYISKDKIREMMNHYRKLYKEDNSPNQFLMEQTYLSKLSLLYDLLEE